MRFLFGASWTAATLVAGSARLPATGYEQMKDQCLGDILKKVIKVLTCVVEFQKHRYILVR